MSQGFSFANPLPIIGRGFVWKLYQGEDFLAPGRFSIEQWNRIVTDIYTMEQWQSFLKEFSDYCTCYVLYKDGDETPLAMSYVMAEHGRYDNYKHGEVVSAHGGGWFNDFGHKYLYAKSWLCLVNYLSDLGCKVLTNATEDNRSALHLIKNTGFHQNNDGMYELIR